MGRTLVGDAGQRVQGFLTKLGLTTNYALVNAFPLAVHPSKVSKALTLLSDPAQLAWRNRFYDLITDSRLQAIIAFGGNAQAALRLWDNAPDVPTSNIPHPSAHNGADLAAKWATRSPTHEQRSPPIPAVTTPAPTTAPASPKPTTPPSRTPTSPYGQPIWIGNDKSRDAPTHPGTTTPSNDPATTPTTR